MRFLREQLTQGAFLLASAMLISGCGSAAPQSRPAAIVSSPATAPVPAAAPARAPAPKAFPGSDPRVIIDTALDRTLQLLGVGTMTGGDGLLRVQINVRNITDSPKWFSYRIDWFDKNGALLAGTSDGDLPWMLLAGETSSIVATAPAVTAKDFEVAFLAGVKQ